MLSCEDCGRLFSDALEGNLPPDREAELLEHLDTCPDCAATAEGLSAAHRLLLEGKALRMLARRGAPGRPRPRTGRVVGLLAAAAAVLLAAGGFWLLRRRGPKPPIRAAVASLEGSAEVLRDGRRFSAPAGTALLPGDRIETGADGAVNLVYADEETRVLLQEDSTLDVLAAGGGRHLRLAAGRLAADVAPQPGGAPFTVTTPQARAAVMGTRFTVWVSRDEDTTRVEVAKGRVRLTRLADGASADVPAGMCAVAGPGNGPVPMPLAAAGDADRLAPVGKDRLRGYALPAGWSATGIICDGKDLWLCCRRDDAALPDTLWRVDPDTGEVLARVAVDTPLFPTARIAWDRGRIWARTDRTLSYALVAIDPATGRRTGLIDTKRLIGKTGAFDVRDGTLWHAEGSQILKIDLMDFRIVQKIDAGQWDLYALAVASNVIYCREAGRKVKEFDARDGSLLRSYEIEGQIEDLAMDSAGRLWGVSLGNRSVILVEAR